MAWSIYAYLFRNPREYSSQVQLDCRKEVMTSKLMTPPEQDQLGTSEKKMGLLSLPSSFSLRGLDETCCRSHQPTAKLCTGNRCLTRSSSGWGVKNTALSAD